MTTEKVTFTPEEEAEFTFTNALAYDIARKEAAKKNTRLPAWLCTSKEAKLRMRQEAYDLLNKHQHPIIPFSEDTIDVVERLVKEAVPHSLIEAWKRMELERKQLRAEGNPHAFFC